MLFEANLCVFSDDQWSLITNSIKNTSGNSMVNERTNEWMIEWVSEWVREIEKSIHKMLKFIFYKQVVCQSSTSKRLTA